MYCRKCGKEMKDDDKFCAGCGMNVDDSVAATSEQPAGRPVGTPVSTPVINPLRAAAAVGTSSTGVYFITSLVASVLAVIFLFQNWFTGSALGYQESVTLVQIFKFANQLKGFLEYSDSTGSIALIYIVVILLFALFILSIAFLAVHFFKFLGGSKSADNFRRGMNSIIWLSAVSIIIILILNAELKSASEGFISGLFSVAAPVYIVGIGALVCRVYLVRKMEEEIYRRSIVSAPAGKKSCPDCKSIIDADYTSCPKCGYRFNEKPHPASWTCQKCGTSNPDGKLFCINCGSFK